VDDDPDCVVDDEPEFVVEDEPDCAVEDEPGVVEPDVAPELGVVPVVDPGAAPLRAT